jgi:hypothetical protein
MDILSRQIIYLFNRIFLIFNILKNVNKVNVLNIRHYKEKINDY